jgi:O-antigen/teichoic acid export membrane protein
LSGIRQLAGQTAWYGLSNIGGRFLNYLVTPIITYLIGSRTGQAEMGTYVILYGYIAFLNIVFTYGFETAYFRFSNKEGVSHKALFQTAFTSHIISTIFFILIIALLRKPLGDFVGVNGHYEYILLCLFIIGFDTLCVIPLAKLRKENRPRKYAFVNLIGITVFVLLTIFFLAFLPGIADHTSLDFVREWYGRQTNTGLLLKANCAQAFVTFILLFKEWITIRFQLSKNLWRQLWRYSSPMIIGGLAGMTNEVIDRQMLAKLLPGTQQDAKVQVAIYTFCYKLSIFITLFTSAFKMAAEPFFFSQSREQNARQTYARVMKWFVATLCVAFLFTALFLDIWQYILGKNYRSGIGIVPILLGANLCLGIYYNLSIWYKLADRMRVGMYITLFGSLITFSGNYLLIPVLGIYASAWTTLVCYFVMMLIAYLLGQRQFPIPYPVRRIALYLGAMLLAFLLHWVISLITDSLVIRVASGGVLFGLFLLFLLRLERRELTGMPLIGKYIGRYLP